MKHPMLFLYTDFGLTGPYVGQMTGAALAAAPGVRVLDLMHDAPAFAPRPAAYLLAALVRDLPAGAGVCAVVDPGVGTARRALMLEADGRRLIGPDNGLMAVVARHAVDAAWHRLDWRPESLSASFHGRDLFAPAAARWLAGEVPAHAPLDATGTAAPVGVDWPADLAEVIYLDGYGNAMTGLRAAGLAAGAELTVAGRVLPRRRTFADAADGTPFWYENSAGLAEIAIDRASAAAALDLAVGTPVGVS